MTPFKAAFIRILTCLLLITLLSAGGCRKKSTPVPSGLTPAEQTAKEKEFLGDPSTILCPLEETTISKLDIPEENFPSFIRRMQYNKKKALKQAHITLESHDYLVLLGETPTGDFSLYDIQKQQAPSWWGSWSLYSKHPVGGKLYEFLTVDNGTKIAARPYQGDMGIIKIGSGGRDLKNMEFSGSLRDASWSSAAVGHLNDELWPEPGQEFSIPVGDYTPYIMNITYDNLKICISDNYHTNAEGQKRGADRKTVYGITIRKDQPYILDFSTPPVVVFDQPSSDQNTFHPDDEIKFAAVLVDPKLDVMIRGLQDTDVQEDKLIDAPNPSVRKPNKSLEPAVVITRANGEIVAEGTMPFG